MSQRNVILGVSLAFVAVLAFLTLRDFVVNGITPLGIVSLPVIAILGIGVIGAMSQPPRK